MRTQYIFQIVGMKPLGGIELKISEVIFSAYGKPLPAHGFRIDIFMITARIDIDLVHAGEMICEGDPNLAKLFMVVFHAAPPDEQIKIRL